MKLIQKYKHKTFYTWYEGKSSSKLSSISWKKENWPTHDSYVLFIHWLIHPFVHLTNTQWGPTMCRVLWRVQGQTWSLSWQQLQMNARNWHSSRKPCKWMYNYRSCWELCRKSMKTQNVTCPEHKTKNKNFLSEAQFLILRAERNSSQIWQCLEWCLQSCSCQTQGGFHTAVFKVFLSVSSYHSWVSQTTGVLGIYTFWGICVFSEISSFTSMIILINNKNVFWIILMATPKPMMGPVFASVSSHVSQRQA